MKKWGHRQLIRQQMVEQMQEALGVYIWVILLRLQYMKLELVHMIM